MITVGQINVMVEQLVLTKVSLDEFEDWLAQSSWDMHKDADDDARKLVGAIELRLAESKEKTDSDLIAELGTMTGFLRLGKLPEVLTRGTVKSLPFFKFQFESLADAGRPLEMVFE